ncbi:MAG: Ig-like domain-containing protein [archaeon]|nr:Ig-like domain-containing protein [archaeon]
MQKKKLFQIIAIILLASMLAMVAASQELEVCKETIVCGDAIPPMITALYPANGSYVNGLVGVVADAVDDGNNAERIAKIKFYIDGNLRLTDFSRPFSYTWNTNLETEGQHLVKARAYDLAGNWAERTNTVTVDRTPPIVNIINPLNGQTVSGTIPVNADANDNFVVSSVGFYIDGTIKFIDVTPPYSYSWNTAAYLNGNHSITARAVDKAYNAQTHTIIVNVSN